jgi:excisionase family DNA binding protein
MRQQAAGICKAAVALQGLMEGLKMNQNVRTLLSISEAASRWGVSIWTIRRLLEAGDISGVNVGARCLIPMAEIERVEQEGVGKPRARKATAGVALDAR